MRDSPLVVVVVDDRHFEVFEMPFCPGARKSAQCIQVNAVSRVGRDDEMLERPSIQAAPGGVRPIGFARPVHLDVPIDKDRMLARRFADPFLHGEIRASARFPFSRYRRMPVVPPCPAMAFSIGIIGPRRSSCPGASRSRRRCAPHFGSQWRARPRCTLPSRPTAANCSCRGQCSS